MSNVGHSFHCMFYFPVPSDSPRILLSVIVNSSTVLVTWLPPPPEYQNGIITAYVVNVSLEAATQSINCLPLAL